jgi:hypothetical protein
MLFAGPFFAPAGGVIRGGSEDPSRTPSGKAMALHKYLKKQREKPPTRTRWGWF